MNILIIGSTGGTGQQLVKQALERNHTVTAFARNPSKIKITHNNLKVLKGNVLDIESLVDATKGQDAVISSLGHKRFLLPNKILSQGTKNIIKAMNKNNIKRFICVSSLGIGDSIGRMGLYYTLFVIPVILHFYFWDKGKQEKLIKKSELDWTIVRPGVLNNRKPKGNYKHGNKIGNFIWSVRISRADVTDFTLKQLNDKTYIHKTPGVCW